MSDFQAFKIELVGLLSLSKDALHIHAGLAVFLAVALALRGRSAFWPWGAAAAAALAAEILDLRDHLRGTDPVPWGASVHDILNTLLWPTILTLLHLRFRGRMRPPAAPSPAERS